MEKTFWGARDYSVYGIYLSCDYIDVIYVINKVSVVYSHMDSLVELSGIRKIDFESRTSFLETVEREYNLFSKVPSH